LHGKSGVEWGGRLICDNTRASSGELFLARDQNLRLLAAAGVIRGWHCFRETTFYTTLTQMRSKQINSMLGFIAAFLLREAFCRHVLSWDFRPHADFRNFSSSAALKESGMHKTVLSPSFWNIYAILLELSVCVEMLTLFLRLAIAEACQKSTIFLRGSRYKLKLCNSNGAIPLFVAQ